MVPRLQDLQVTEDIMNILAWLAVGLVAGLLASRAVGGTSYGLLGDILTGMLGAFVGCWLFNETGWPIHGLAGTIFVAFVGAAVALVVLRLLLGGTRVRWVP
jgi:uncharacterized membrane protein YeaQ/YmgE (transglycosylase-associated protein family)